ncbi:Protein of unknown function [Oceanospirillum multiglobuliferum]|uniref:DUF2802 domain-containing protein n=1 Tax=Oceanospirillum multiglobuliferum TaxID=64969 RepID=A0A1T4L5H7_9GAMM|nr:DUF2802 domain-containing protein [Oceanospirillum multiglobuliferum]OPX56789.1 hypothetical protein BTE48_02630 [Oceanospirillum multiglobuliferum]SJZ49985.1 Protein of unknown function [Oceanospirillum multiglobuliferum]
MQGFLVSLLLGALSLIAVFVAIYSIRQLSVLREQLAQNKVETEQLVQTLRNETHAMGSGSIGVGQRLLEVEKKLNYTAEKQVELEQKDSGNIPYIYAIRLVEMGASADDLVDNCGLARVEADLLALVHRELNKQKRVEQELTRY